MEVKGSAIVVLPKFIKSRFGKKRFRLWLDALSEEAKEVYSRKILLTSWFALNTIFIEPTREMCKKFFNGDLEGSRELGRFSAEYALGGIYKAYIRTANPQSLTKRASQIFSTYYRPSSMETGVLKGKEVLLKITEFPEMDIIVENRILGWIEKALEICAYKNINLKVVKSLASGESATEIEITWS